MKYLICVVAVLFSTSVIAQEVQVYVEKYSNGNRKIEAAVENGRFEGVYLEWYESGVLKTEGAIFNGLKVLEWKYYYPSGKLSRLDTFYQRKSSIYFLGKDSKTYYENRQLQEIGSFVYSNEYEKHGEWKSYYENGQLRYSAPFEYGRLIGTTSEYYENGNLKEEGSWVSNDCKDDIWKTYYPSGQLISITDWDWCELDGKCKFYYPNGQLAQIRLYDSGNFMDVLEYYNNNGTPLDKGSLNNGNGTFNAYDENGKLLKTHTYVDGVLQN